MPRYLIQRTFSVGAEQMPQVGTRSRTIIRDQFPEVIWEHSHVVIGADGLVRSFCVYDAPDEETVRRHAEMLGEHLLDGLHEIVGDVTPEDFPLADQAA